MANRVDQDSPIHAAKAAPVHPTGAHPTVAHPSVAQPSGPIPARERIQTLDVLRGFALFGILLVNMTYFSFPVQYAMFPHPDSGPINRAAEWLMRFLAEGKFFSLFSLLFGLGFTIQMTRAEAKGVSFVPRYLRRAGVLALFGLLHGLLLWVGDILFYYAILGVLLIFFRRMKFKWVWTWIVMLLLLPALFTSLGYFSYLTTVNEPALEQAVSDQVAAQQAMFEEMAAQAYEVYANGSYLEVTQQRVQDLIFMWAISLFLAPTIFAMFLLGSIFGRKGYIEHAEQHTRLFQKLLIWGGIIGVISNAIYATLILNGSRLEVDLGMFIATWAHTVGAPALMLAYVSAITLGMLNVVWRPRLSVLAPVGRMALTNYLLQSLICTTIFYGYGLGLFGQVGAAAGIVLAIIIYALQIPWSHWWLARFHFGPAEWLWRTLTYGQRQPFRRTQVVAPAAG
jgi:uncharacterized protein